MTHTEFLDNQINKLQPRIERLEKHITQTEAWFERKHENDMKRLNEAIEQWKEDGETDVEYMALEMSDAISNSEDEEYFELERDKEALKELKETLRHFTEIRRIIETCGGR